jgi:hypothetical protein
MLKSSLNFKYTGPVPKTKSLDMSLAVTKTGLEKIELKTKLSAKDESAGIAGVVCIDVTATQAKVSDFFDYHGENEPTYERTINVAWSKDDKSKDASCPANSAGIKIVKKAHRSQAQKEEAESDVWPYKQCREQKNSPKYPGDLTPATEPCLWAAYKQTNLRESNITINYRVDPDARKRWRYPGAIVAAILMPYWVPSDTVDGHAAHGEHGVDADGHIQGEIKLDVTMDEENPEADIHWHGSEGEQEHFHGVDLNFLPGPVRLPVHSRFSGLMYTAFKMGIYGYCDVSVPFSHFSLDYFYSMVFILFLFRSLLMLFKLMIMPPTLLISPNATPSFLEIAQTSPGLLFLERKSLTTSSDLRLWLENTRSNSTT